MEPKCFCGASSSDFDFGFAFNDPNYSDRVLRIEIMTDPPPNSDNVTTTMDTVVRVQTLHISSPILAAKSPFFYKLLSNGMMESGQKHVTLKIHASEEAASMELLNFMYTNTLNNITPASLMDVLILSDKFDVSSCMRYCTKLLLNSPMTPESASLYLNLPHTLLMADAVQPLADAANQYLASPYKDIKMFEQEVMALSLSRMEAILASDDLQVDSEDDVYDFVLNWARQHYNNKEERQQILGRLARLIRFPHMTVSKLENVLTCNDFKHEDTSKLVNAALLYKASPLHDQWRHAFLDSHFVERAYKCRPVKVVGFELPRPRWVVYWDLKREELATLFPSCDEVCSQTFHLGTGQEFYLAAKCFMDELHGSFHSFRLYFGTHSHFVCFDVDFEFAARSRSPTEEFVTKFKGSTNYFSIGVAYGVAYGPRNLFQIPWSSFIAEDSPFFINGVLHLRAEFTITTY